MMNLTQCRQTDPPTLNLGSLNSFHLGVGLWREERGSRNKDSESVSGPGVEDDPVTVSQERGRGVRTGGNITTYNLSLQHTSTHVTRLLYHSMCTLATL